MGGGGAGEDGVRGRGQESRRSLGSEDFFFLPSILFIGRRLSKALQETRGRREKGGGERKSGCRGRSLPFKLRYLEEPRTRSTNTANAKVFTFTSG